MADSLRGRWIPLLVCVVSGGTSELAVAPARAAENLPPLRVDPALLLPATPRVAARPPASRPQPAADVVAPPPAADQAARPQPAPLPAARDAAATARPPADAQPPRAPTSPVPAPAPAAAPRPQAPAASAAVATPASAGAPAARPLPAPAEPSQTPSPAAPAAPAADRAPAPPRPQAPAEPTAAAPQLSLSSALQPPFAGDDRNAPTHIAADRLRGVIDLETEAEGDAQLRRPRTTVSADRLLYRHPDDEVEGTGNVRVIRDRDVVTGPSLRLKVDETIGHMETPSYTINRPPQQGSLRASTSGSGEAALIEFQGENHYRLENATYSTCPAGRTDWYAQMAELKLDYDREVGEARDAKLYFQGVPLLYSPWLEFSLNNRRKSGFLAPTVGGSSRTGTEISIPYYWNIAPNRDATIVPRLMARRGLLLGGEFRYLDPAYLGTVQAEYLPKDNLTGEGRHHYAIVHNHILGSGFAASLNVNGVSDPLYFTDLSSRITNTSQQLLLRQGTLTYSSGWWGVAALVQSYQALQHPLLPAIGIPYERLPQFNIGANRYDLNGFAFNLAGEFVDFKHPTAVIGRRLTAYPQLSYPMQSASFFLTPKIGAHVSNYSLERQPAGTPSTLSRSVPIASIDGGVIFERDTEWLGKSYTQTLEPRLFYVYVPFRDQSRFPVFDSGVADFNFAQLFTELVYVGNDRVGDANQLTAAVTSRLVDPISGEELMRGTIGQRYYFSGQRVTFPGFAPRPHDSSDILAALSGRVLPGVQIDTALQFNPNEGQMRRIVMGARYSPSATQVLNASYRFQRDVLREIDVSAQWPLWGNWYGVGRYNYSLRDKRLVEAIGGLEYDGGCWILRAVFQRFATATQTANTAFFLQLELNGLTRLGSNPLETLKRSIPGYGKINAPVTDPVFGE